LFALDLKVIAANLLRLAKPCQGELISCYIFNAASLPFACFFQS
jgi:hypothetical protein